MKNTVSQVIFTNSAYWTFRNVDMVQKYHVHIPKCSVCKIYHRYLATQYNTVIYITLQWQGWAPGNLEITKDTPLFTLEGGMCIAPRKFSSALPTMGNHKIAPVSAMQPRRIWEINTCIFSWWYNHDLKMPDTIVCISKRCLVALHIIHSWYCTTKYDMIMHTII